MLEAPERAAETRAVLPEGRLSSSGPTQAKPSTLPFLLTSQFSVSVAPSWACLAAHLCPFPLAQASSGI